MFKRSIVKAFDLAGYALIKRGVDRMDADIKSDADFVKIYEECRPFTMVSLEKSYALYKATQYIVHNKIPGDFVECGVWKGGQAMIMAKTLLHEGDTDRDIYLFDTFTGMTEPSTEDVHVADGSPARDTWAAKNTDSHNDWCYASLDEVRKNLTKTGYPKERLFFEKGLVEDTIPSALPAHISLLRLDTDWYDSTKHELDHAFPRVALKGVLVIDDYGTWAGSRKATDEYFQANDTSILLTKIGKSGRIGVKT